MRELVEYANKLSLLIMVQFAEIARLNAELEQAKQVNALEKAMAKLFGNYQTYTIEEGA